ncbi:nuclease-related domain-containing protein [Streptomyces sp. NBRC 109706]|uniref:nuclease-related domain-containing protein n=1 Tax=Streptomyces sp. NBRC 109706 TaxID=1550035 RepID=UPI0007853F51|nr:nuclease-related domain-containing protein [Streptomyces sp. NBRC 109706]
MDLLLAALVAVGVWLYRRAPAGRRPRRRGGPPRRPGRRGASPVRRRTAAGGRRPAGRVPGPRHRPNPTGDAGSSAAARAAHLRRSARGGLGRQALAALGVPDAAGDRQRAQAARWEAGAAGERATAGILRQLPAGWTVLHDRALPRGRANVDHLVISPCARVWMPDSKRWSARTGTVHARRGRLYRGSEDWTRALDSVEYEAREVSRALGGVTVTPVIVVHGAPVAGGGITVRGVRIIPTAGLLAELRAGTTTPAPPAARQLADRARAALPSYQERNR